MILTFRYRVKSHLGELNRQARAVNFVWNFCNDTQKHALKWGKRWPTGYDLAKLASGASGELGLPSISIDRVCNEYGTKRRAAKKRQLRYRGRRSLGWIPLRASQIRKIDDGFRCGGLAFKVFDSRKIPAGAKIKDGSSFSQDARGNWFLNIAIEIEAPALREPLLGVGVDLGLKEIAVLSDGSRVENPRHFRAAEKRLATTQRANKKRQAKNIHASIANSRRDHLHKAALSIVRRFDYIAVGNVNAAGFAKTSMAKSVKDASWTTFRNMLRYKAITHGATVEEVDERWTTQTCNECGVIAGPKGRAGLNERTWKCVCGATHDRDVNAARNILMRRSGHRAPVEGALACHSG